VNAQESSAQALVGATLNGRFRLVRLLGEGGMGAVYEADGTRGEGKRAIKVLHREFIQEQAIVERFFAEAQASRSLVHPNIALIEASALAEDGSPYLVMELLQGVPLATYMDQLGAIPPSQSVPILYGVLQALGAAHAQRIVHRDLKPDNVFLVRDARGGTVAKLLDFGIAKVMDLAGGMGSRTRTGMLLGTPGYMSPEQIKNSKGVDARSDLWSLAIIFYEMLTGQMPFHADTEIARLTAVLTEPIRPIEEVKPELASWAGFFRRALAKDPAQRFQSADEMSRALAAAAQPASAALPPTVSPAHAAAARPVTPAGPVAGSAPGSQAWPGASQPTPLMPPPVGATSPSAPIVTIPAALTGPRTGTIASGSAAPNVSVIDAPPLQRAVALWVVGVVGLVCLGLGFIAGFLAGGR
jgi:serine/threonine-protein kinase